MNATLKNLTSGRLLARSAVWNLIGMGAPMLVALIAIPLLIEGLGKERFGLLAIIWIGVGYLSFFDLGLGRALTKLVSEKVGKDEIDDLGPLIWTAITLLAGLGVIGAALLVSASPLLVNDLLKVPDVLREEAIAAFRILAIGVPIVIVTAGLIGILQAHQRFKAIAHIRVPLGILTFVGPLMTLQFTPSIAWATVVLLAGRTIGMALYYWAVCHVRHELRSPLPLQRRHVKPLLSFGGWLTVTNIIGPLMTYMDRFFIGAMLGLSAVTYYVTPYEVLARMQIIPQAVMGVLFPAMSAAYSGESKRLIDLYLNGSKILYWGMLPILAAAFLLGPEALLIWLGDDFRVQASVVVHWLAVGWMFNILAQPAFAVLQSAGRPDLTAKAHLAELVPYLVVLWIFAGLFGIAGVAAAWALRVCVDALALNILVAWVLPLLRRQVLRTLWVLLATSVVFAGFTLLESIIFRLMTLALVAATATIGLLPMLKKAIHGKVFL